MIKRVMSKIEFKDYHSFFRHKNFLVCRKQEGFSTIDDSQGSKQLKYQLGDVRILFEVVACPSVSVCGQQVQSCTRSTVEDFVPPKLRAMLREYD